MIKRITISIVVLFSMFSLAQQSTSSPYSYFGIGETKFRGSPEQRAMGGIGVFPDSIHLNLLNPASYSSLKLTAITVGGGTTFNQQESSSDSGKTRRTSLDYLAIGIPMGKFGVAFGLNPQTVVGYRIMSINDDNSALSLNSGEGGSNRVFLGGAYQITPQLSFGVEGSYYFGTINTLSRMYENTQYSTRTDTRVDLSGFSLGLGMMYRTKVNQKYDVYTSANYISSYGLNFEKNITMGTIGVTPVGNEYYNDFVELPQEKESYTMPSRFSVGAGFGQLKKWSVGTEFYFAGKNKISSPLSGSSATYDNTNAMRFSLGGYYIPKYNSFTSYFQRVTYRAGLRYENTGLVVNGQTINDMGVSAGFALPIGNGLSDLSFAFEYGKRGTKSAGLIQENYFNISIAVSITDKWFRKYLYD
ncbi:MAG: hypothetical protein AB7D46_06130 [Flavobacteriaceae bacterium]